MNRYRSATIRATVAALGVLTMAVLPACSTDGAQTAMTSQALGNGHGASNCDDGEGRSLLGLYQSTANFGPELPANAIDWVMLQPGCTAIGFTGTQNFGAFVPPPGVGFPSNAVGSLVTWHVHRDDMELRMLRPLFVPTGSPFPSQTLFGYLRGLIDLEAQPDGTWSGDDAQIDAVELYPILPCANPTQHAPCVVRQYSGSVTLAPIDPWDTGVPAP